MRQVWKIFITKETYSLDSLNNNHFSIACLFIPVTQPNSKQPKTTLSCGMIRGETKTVL